MVTKAKKSGEPVRSLYSEFLKRKVDVQIIEFKSDKPYPNESLLVLNDGQDYEKLFAHDIIAELVAEHKIAPVTVVAIHAGKRMDEYGVSLRADYLGRGSKAAAYENFVINELLPWLLLKTGKKFKASSSSFAGFSLGALSALDIATSNPDYFSSAGVFSGSLWWRSKGYDEGYTENDRIIFQKLSAQYLSPDFRCWMMAGTNDERNDRNNNGIIDSVDDTLDLYELLIAKSIFPSNIKLNIVKGGTHDMKTWSQQFPGFLKSAFGNSDSSFL